jgi:RNA polymerase sigma-70 factor (ECF subfamily)
LSGVASHPDLADLADDQRLARSIAAGSEEAFEALVARHHRRLAGIAGRFFRRPETVEEILQDVFVKAFVGMARYRGEMPLEHWLSRIAVNACYDQLRRQKSRPETPMSQLGNETGTDSGFFDRLTARSSAGDDAFWRRENARLTAESMLALLSPAERLVLTLMVLEELSVAEVARMTGWSQANVKVRAFRARVRLRKRLEEESRAKKVIS